MTSAKGGWTQILNQAGGQWIAEDIMIENSGKLDPKQFSYQILILLYIRRTHINPPAILIQYRIMLIK